VFFGQVELSHFRICFSDILVGFGQIGFQIDGAFVGFYRPVELPLFAVAIP
jgi:hypothetical protein